MEVVSSPCALNRFIPETQASNQRTCSNQLANSLLYNNDWNLKI